MQTVIPGLYASAPEALRFAPKFDIRAFLLARKQGNLLVYSVGALASEAQSVKDLGGISRHYLSHWHEVQLGCDRIASTFHAPVLCHENERHSVAKTCKVGETFFERHMLGDDFEVVPIPGHTSGASAFLWQSGEHRCLFTGDTIYLRDGDWIAAVLESSDRGSYLESLEGIKELDFDVLVPWLASRGQAFHAFTDKADTRRRIDAILERLRRGEDH
jgi:glyoxylase-like metal-dependent hydrolase (beta-lactamase superfamily II)